MRCNLRLGNFSGAFCEKFFYFLLLLKAQLPELHAVPPDDG
jgi:hypothetical protein